MVVDESRARLGRVEKIGAKIPGFLERHVAAGAVPDRFLRIVKTARAVARNAAEQIGVVVILAAQEFLIFVQFQRDADFVAGGTELRRPHGRFEKRLLVELGLPLDQLLVQVLQETVRAIGKGVVDRLVDGVVRVAARTVDVGHRVARRAGNARLRRGMTHVVKFRVVERAAEERHHVVAARAPPRGPHVAVAPERHPPRLPHAEQIRLVVERAEMMRAVKPAAVGVFVAFQAVVVHHQRPRRDEVARRGAGKRRLEIFLPFRRTDRVLPGMLRMQEDHSQHDEADRRGPLDAGPPFDARPREPVQDVEPHRQHRRDHVRPVRHRA